MVAFTITPSRAAARLNSGVRPQCGKGRVVSCFGKSTGCFPVGSGHRCSPFPVSASSRLRPWRQVRHTRIAFGFGGSARQAYIGAAAFPCDPASPLFSTTRQALHNIAGAVQYIGGGIALTTLAERFGKPFETAGFIVLVTAIALCFSSPVRGVIQRIAETCLFGGLALAVWQIGAAV